MQHYEKAHNREPSNAMKTPFPYETKTRDFIRKTALSVKRGKALAWDAVDDDLFNIEGRCCKAKTSLC